MLSLAYSKIPITLADPGGGGGGGGGQGVRMSEVSRCYSPWDVRGIGVHMT